MATQVSPRGETARAVPSVADRLGAFALALLCGFVVQIPHLLARRAFVNLDFRVHYNYAREYVASMQGGDPWPRWAFLAQDGLGEPGLLYYSPLSYMATWLFSLLTHNTWVAMQLVEIAAAGALGWFAWRLSVDWGAGRWALLAVPLAVLSPMLCLLHLGFNGYPWATAIAPLGALAWAVLRPEAQDRLVNPPAILALAVTVLTHTVTGLMAVLMVAALPAAVLVRHRVAAFRRPGFWAPAVTILAGILLSAVYLLPAFASQGLISAGVWRQNYTPFDAFSLSTVTAWIFGMRWFAFQWPASLIAYAMALIPLVALARSPDAPGGRAAFAGAMAITAMVVLLSTELSYPLWLFDSPLRNVQFPHRFISILVPLGAVLAAVGLARIDRPGLRAALGLAALAGVGMGLVVVAKAALRDGQRLDVAEARFDAYVGLDEYRTATATALGVRGNDFRFADECAGRAIRCAEGERRGRAMRWTIAAERAGPLRLPVYCFPAWAVTIDDRPAPAACDRETALVRVEVPQGRSVVAVAWRMLPVERLGLALSLVAALATAGMAWAAGVAARRPRPDGFPRRVRRG